MWYVGPKSALLNEPLCWVSVLGVLTPLDTFVSVTLPRESSSRSDSRTVLVAIQRGKISERLKSQIRKVIKHDVDVIVLDMRPKKAVEDLAINLGCVDYIRLPVSRDLFLARLRIYFGGANSLLKSPLIKPEGSYEQKVVGGAVSQLDFSDLIVKLLSLKGYPLSSRAERMRSCARTALVALSARVSAAVSDPEKLADGIARIALVQELGGIRFLDELVKGQHGEHQIWSDFNVPGGFFEAAALALSYQHGACRHPCGSSPLEIRNSMPLLSQLFLLLDAYDSSLFKDDDLSVSRHEQAVSNALSTAGSLVGQPLLEAFSSIGEELRFIALQSQSG